MSTPPQDPNSSKQRPCSGSCSHSDCDSLDQNAAHTDIGGSPFDEYSSALLRMIPQQCTLGGTDAGEANRGQSPLSRATRSCDESAPHSAPTTLDAWSPAELHRGRPSGAEGNRIPKRVSTGLPDVAPSMAPLPPLLSRNQTVPSNGRDRGSRPVSMALALHSNFNGKLLRRRRQNVPGEGSESNSVAMLVPGSGGDYEERLSVTDGTLSRPTKPVGISRPTGIERDAETDAEVLESEIAPLLRSSDATAERAGTAGVPMTIRGEQMEGTAVGIIWPLTMMLERLAERTARLRCRITGLLTEPQIKVLKATIAYGVASLFAFVPFLRSWLGDPSFMSPHLVVNATIWFHAAKTRSGLTEGAVVGLIWLVTAVCVSYISLGITEYLHEQYVDTTPLPSHRHGHGSGNESVGALDNHRMPGYWDTHPLAKASKVASLTLMFAITWVVAFFKANSNRPSVKTAAAIANVTIYIVFCREMPLVNYQVALKHSGSPAAGLSRNALGNGNGEGDETEPDWPFPSDKVTLGESVGQKAIHTLVALCVGILISCTVGWWVAHRTAADQLRKQLCKTFSSLSDLVEQLSRPFIVSHDEVGGDGLGAAMPKLLGKTKSEGLRATLRGHRKQTLSLRDSLEAMLLEPSETYMWCHRGDISRLVRRLDGLSIQLCSMGSGIELQHGLWNRHANTAPASGDGQQEAATRTMLLVMNRMSGPIAMLAASCQKSIKRLHDLLDTSLAPQSAKSKSENIPAVALAAINQQVATIRDEMNQAMREFEMQYETAIDAITEGIFTHSSSNTSPLASSSPEAPSATSHSSSHSRQQQQQRIGDIMKSAKANSPPPSALTPAEEQLFVVFFFVFGLREFATQLYKTLPYVRLACQPLPPRSRLIRAALSKPQFLMHRLRQGIRWARHLAQGLVHTGATTALESQQELNSFDPKALHNPRPQNRWQQFGYRLWKFGVWLRQPNVRFAFKCAILITLLGIPAFYSWDSYVWFRTYRGEWMLISASAILVPTVGASSLTGIYRILGNCAGGAFAYVVYETSQGNSLIAYTMSVLFSIPCYHLMLNTGYPRIGQLMLVTYGVILINKWISTDDEKVGIGQLAISRTVSVSLGVTAGLLFTIYIWPYEARVRLRQAISLWLLSASVLYDRLWRLGWSSYAIRGEAAVVASTPSGCAEDPAADPLDVPITPAPRDVGSGSGGEQQEANKEPISTVREYLQMEVYLQQALTEIGGLLSDTQNEPRLKGPLPIEHYRNVLTACQRLLDAMVSARWSMLPISTSLTSVQELYDIDMGDQHSYLDHTATGSLQWTPASELSLGLYERGINSSSVVTTPGVDSYGARMPYGPSPSTPFTSMSARRLTVGSDIMSSYLDLPLVYASSTMTDTRKLQSVPHDVHRFGRYHYPNKSFPQSSVVATSNNNSVPTSGMPTVDRTTHPNSPAIRAHQATANNSNNTPHQSLVNVSSSMGPAIDGAGYDDLDINYNLIGAKIYYELLLPTAREREQLDGLVTLSLYVLASALILKMPLPPLLPPVTTAYEQLTDHIQKLIIPKMTQELEDITSTTDNDDNDEVHQGNEGAVESVISRKRYVFYYTHVLLAGEIVRELDCLGQEMQKLYGCLNPSRYPATP
ncbi:hypothetical protein EV182_000407 [Spiromyces aspiralis]|uniref:Uncharacterized protein n=1 Tax=Spiromyces aspiralis TaxID=68401 RepID=A0ACC1HGY1_9FUNG|nr:hypothetical protein EV182_000407 [Spiromyces aspiralis]